MRAAVITSKGGPEVLEIREVPDPVPGDWEILVRVEGSALNRADLLQRRGLYPAPTGSPQDIPGLELSGTVVARGRYVTRFDVGDPVIAITGGGACAELAVLHEREAIARPAGLDAVAAAAIPEAFITAFDAICLQGGLQSGQWLAIDAVGSGVGTAALQIARAIGAKAAGSTRTQAKLDKALALGLDHGVPGTTEALAAALRALGGAAVGLELVGGPQLAHMLRALRPTGVAVLVGLMAGAQADLPLATILRKRLRVIGTVLRSRPLEEKLAVARAFEDRMKPLFEGPSPRLVPVIDRTFGLAEIAAAHAYMEKNRNFGKIVLDHG